ncbi:hypothetical protein N7495_000744 [Penicillium taxi]|uniref:uncharacterized protein n=1 Tax=Penicillium taxi TaxID=168475 RepID=UPI00254578AD|nr:uncharacterized protein N7495_000744 [Penicillium taxi]KAJ5908062.1 hypothetical protein N7495_000744 [Penicillium taxi]
MIGNSKPKSLTFMARKTSNNFALAEHYLSNNYNLFNQTQRFELWAKNLGLYHLGHSSLDYRFRDAPSLLEYTMGLLRNLEGLLAQFIHIRNPEHVSTVDVKNTTDLPITSHERLSDDSEDDDFESSDDESVTDLLLNSVNATIDKLYRLSFKIRNPAMRLGFSRSLKYQKVDPETGVNLIDQFRENDQRHLEQLFACYRSTSADEFETHFLVQRLAKGNTRRRQQFGYWKRRRGQFETESKTELEPCLVPRKSENIANPNMLKVLIASSRPSTATHLDVSKVKLEDNTSIISSSTVVNMDVEGNGDYFYIPPPPKHLWDREEFECPYCFTLCPRKMLHQTNWQTHILRDLRPYICTYEECRDANQQYDSFSDWIKHETFMHQNKSDLANSANVNMPILESRKCPFCLEDAGPHHITTHLRRVACFSLPRFIENDDGSLQGNQISSGADRRSNNTGSSETTGEISISGDGPESEVDKKAIFRKSSLLTSESLRAQQPDRIEEKLKVNWFLDKLETESHYIDLSSLLFDGMKDTEADIDHNARDDAILGLKLTQEHKAECEAAKAGNSQILHQQGAAKTLNAPVNYDAEKKGVEKRDKAFPERLEDRWEEAEQLEVQVIEMSKTKLIEDHPDTLTSMANLASTYRDQGRLEEAERLEVQVMETRKTTLGEDHPSTLNSMTNLASTLYSQGRWEEAERLFMQVMETRKTTLGEDFLDTLTSMANLASTYRNQGRWEEAEEMYQRALAGTEKALGPDHTSTLDTVNNLGLLYSDQGKLKEAEEMYQRAIAGYEKALGPDHTSTLDTVQNLENLYREKGKPKDAENLYQGDLPDSQKAPRRNAKRAGRAIAKLTGWLKK